MKAITQIKRKITKLEKALGDVHNLCGHEDAQTWQKYWRIRNELISLIAKNLK
jgi:hypothetical protein